MTLRSLQEWGIVSRIHMRGDRKEYFQAEQDIWKLFRTILRERKKREIDPLIEALRTCRDLTATTQSSRRIGPEGVAVDAHNVRLDSMLEFIQMIDSISQRLIASGKGLELAAKFSRGRHDCHQPDADAGAANLDESDHLRELVGDAVRVRWPSSSIWASERSGQHAHRQ
jgi:hypothetical protein